MKKLNRFIIFATVLATTTLTSYSWDFEVDGFCYNKLSDSTCELALPTEHGSLSYYTGDIKIPEQVSYRGVNYTVTSIGINALSRSYTSSGITYNEDLLSVELPQTIEIIREKAFVGCNKLKKIVIPSSVIGIGYTAFYGCSNITDVIIEDSDKPLKFACGNTSDRGVFSSCPLKNVYIGRNIVHESNYLVTGGALYGFNEYYGPFTYKKHLKSIEISPNVTEIQDYMFYNSTGINNIYIGENVTKIGRNAFAECSNLTTVFGNLKLEEISYQAFSDISKDSKIYLFSSFMKKIESEAFNVNSTLFVIDKEQYELLLDGYNVVQLFNVPNLNVEYSGMPINIAVTNNSDLPILDLSSPKDCGIYTSIKCTIDVIGLPLSINIPCQIQINPTVLTAIANDASRQYGTENPEFTCSFFGLKNNETQDVLTKQPTIETTATITSNVGSYPIIPYGAEARNYTFTYERGLLNITKANQEIVWSQVFDDVHVGDIIELTAESSSGLDIKYTSTDETIAEIFTQSGKKYVEFLKTGNVSIRANQAGNENYNEADRVSKSIEVKAKSILVSSLTFDCTEWNGYEDSNFQINATILPENATNKALQWSSSDEDVATVDNDGFVTILAPGDCIISAKTLDGSNLSADCSIKAVSGINMIEFDENAMFDVYNSNGIMIKKSASNETLNSLSPGLYIIIQNGIAHKIMIK